MGLPVHDVPGRRRRDGEACAESGCISVFVGMESLDEDALDETNKPFNRVLKFSKKIKMFHDYGIIVNPGIVFGFDQVELAYFNVLTPIPGTALFDRFERQVVSSIGTGRSTTASMWSSSRAALRPSNYKREFTSLGC